MNKARSDIAGMPVETVRRRADWSRIVTFLRGTRRLHKYVGVSLAAVIFFSALTGFLLGWKKNVSLLQPPTQRGSATALSEWRPIGELEEIGRRALAAHLGVTAAPAVDRLDVRPDRSIVKVVFKKGSWEVQVDGGSGEVLSIARRHSDWVEHLHDGSIVGEGFKVAAMSTLGLALMTLATTGIWLWSSPGFVRRRKRLENERSRASGRRRDLLS
jgi:uncharacterized iron-regulated membrane protein